LQPFPVGTDYFAALGVERCPALERAVLDERYYERSRQLHPDRYQNSPPEEQAASADNAALLNRAYRTLRDPVERGRYWLQLRGIAGDARQTTVPAALVAIVFDVQEQLEQVRAADAAQRTALIPELAATRRRIEQIHAGEMERLDENLAAWRDPHRDEVALGALLSRILADVAYVGALLRDIDKALDA
jgi:molecular chaperone HscB